jgi:hypothetical protein
MNLKQKEKKKPFLIDLSVADDVHQILKPCPAVGEGVHHGILGAVRELALLGYSPEEIAPMVEECVCAAGTTPYPREIQDALNKVFGDGDPQLNNLTYEKTPIWPDREPFQAVRTAQQYNGLDELLESSPDGRNNIEHTTDDWLDFFYQDTDLLCIGEYRYETDVKSRAEWRGRVERAVYIVPNVFHSKFSGRCNENIRMPRKYLLTEMDISPIYIVWRMILQKYRINHFDVQAGIICYLRSLGTHRLASVVWSGNKSMHAYWYPNIDEALNRSFMENAVRLGADKAGWTASQFARIPNPGAPFYQEILYLDPMAVL